MRSDLRVVLPGEKDVHGGWGRLGGWSVPDEQTMIRSEIYTGERRGYLTVTLGEGGDGDGFVQGELTTQMLPNQT